MERERMKGGGMEGEIEEWRERRRKGRGDGGMDGEKEGRGRRSDRRREGG